MTTVAAAPARPALRSVLSAVPAYRPGRRAQSERTAPLAANESHFSPLPSVQEAIVRAASAANRYPDAASTELRHVIAGHLAASPEQIAVSPGSVGAIQQLMATFCDAGDEVVFAWRSFEAYPLLTRLAGARPVPVPLTTGLDHDLPAMLAAITEQTRMVLLCTPNNPTGNALDEAALEAFLDQVPPTVLVVVDEAYAEYGRDVNPLDRIQQRSNVCVLRTFSKAYGLAGLRVGYAVTSEELAHGLRQTALPFGVSTIAQEAAIASLGAADELAQRVAAVTTERTRVTAELRALGWPIPTSGANFVWLPTGPALTGPLLETFDQADILVRPFADEGLRITLADAATNDRVLEVLQGFQAI
ncbi:histidinol-phosphate transaminase [Kineosporia rhizophila]|uniref:histidinol-phosphate transaminase n=1 Tax=Kineosporia rhizophila TaxID=84633 RepID=UPI001E474EF0|nr:histidinol-phosphate transaminase [Kineosporia rhizophila]MCE0540487.1 histidinol-phosphate transaminase [Kineosporia rhizophila]